MAIILSPTAREQLDYLRDNLTRDCYDSIESALIEIDTGNHECLRSVRRHKDNRLRLQFDGREYATLCMDIVHKSDACEKQDFTMILRLHEAPGKDRKLFVRSVG